MKDFGHGIRLMALQRIFDEFSPKVEVVENWNDLKNVSVLEQVSCRANCQPSCSFASEHIERWEFLQGKAWIT